MDDTIYNIEQLTHGEVQERIAQTPAVILPLGSCEPFGSAGHLGAGLVCAQDVARAVSARSKILCAPAVPFGCSTPFISFAGTMAVKPRTFINMLCEIICGYVFCGAQKIFLISSAPFNVEPIMEAIERLAKKYPRVTVKMFDINAFGKSEFDRNDALLLSVYEYLRQDSKRAERADAPVRQEIFAQYKTWKKRGKDPQKLRALFPNGQFAAPCDSINATSGKENFERVVSHIAAEILKT